MWLIVFARVIHSSSLSNASYAKSTFFSYPISAQAISSIGLDPVLEVLQEEVLSDQDGYKGDSALCMSEYI